MANLVSGPARGYDRLTEGLPTGISYRLDLARDRLRRMGWSPFNDQQARRALFEELCHRIQFTAIVETGTYRGRTTEYMWQVSHVPVFTVEAVDRLYRFSAARLRRYKQISVVRGDSREFLTSLADRKDARMENPLFYLDGHWQADLPLASELEIITASWPQATIIIDDFRVDDDPGYGYDDFGRDKVICLDIIPVDVRLRHDIFFPATESGRDSGLRRGYCLLAGPRLTPVISEISLLRIIPGSVSRPPHNVDL